MVIDQEENVPWTRKHDNPQVPLIPKARKILYPKSLEEIIDICAKRAPNEFLKAAGSHWALSEAAISDTTFIETHDPNGKYAAMGRTLYNVVPGCLTEQFVDFLGSRHPQPFDNVNANENEGIYLMHFETGKKVYQLYAEMDLGEDENDQYGVSLAHLIKNKFQNSDYFGSWAFPTLGGAGGQTVFGALTTGTHGGDFKIPPIADAVQAMHLVTDGGKHYWIERENNPEFHNIPITDEAALRKLYGDKKYRGNFSEAEAQKNFYFLRNDDIFNAVLISAGRFGVVYSVVIRAVRQYFLHEERVLDCWQNISSQICDPNSPLFNNINTQNLPATPLNASRFLQIAISVTPYDNSTKNLCGITKRWNVPITGFTPGTSSPNGRAERRGDVIENFNNYINAPLFENAGRSFTYSPDPSNPNAALPPNFLDLASENSDFINGAVDFAINELEKYVTTGDVGVFLNKVIAGVVGALPLSQAFLDALNQLISDMKSMLRDILQKAADAIRNNSNTHFAEVLNDIAKLCFASSDIENRKAGVLAWQLIVYAAFNTQQGDLSFDAISYAVMDKFNYRDKSQQVNVHSIEVFCDTTNPFLVAFVDSLLKFEIGQEMAPVRGSAFVGYISIRFTGKTDALIGMERFGHTIVVEVAGLVDANGSKPLIDYALTLARNNNFKGILHWGQRNDQSMSDIQFRFGDSISSPGGDLSKWRRSLSYFTENGQLNGFSSDFTRRLGLEVVTPIITSFTIDNTSPEVNTSFIVSWDCLKNPDYTTFKLQVQNPNGIVQFPVNVTAQCSLSIPASAIGVFLISLTATCTLNGESRDVTEQVSANVYLIKL